MFCIRVPFTSHRAVIKLEAHGPHFEWSKQSGDVALRKAR